MDKFNTTQTMCKNCESIQNLTYRRSIVGLITEIYKSQKRTSAKRGYLLPTYTKSEFKDWLLSQNNFVDLYKNWCKSDYEKHLKPSVDRKDDYETYTITNIQLMTWGENLQKSLDDRKNGVNNKTNKTVLQFSLSNIMVGKYHSAMEAGRVTKVYYTNIIRCCNNERKTAGGFKWRYLDE